VVYFFASYREAVVAAQAPRDAEGDPVKVLHVISSVDPRGGGPVEGVFSSSEVWFRHGHERHIVSLDPPRAPWVATARAPTRGVGPDGALYRLARAWIPWLRYGYTPRLVGWLRQNAPQYDAVIVNGLWNYASFGAWRALHRGSTPYFVFTHGMLDPWFNRAYPTKTFFKRVFWHLFEHKVLRDANGVMFTCEEERRLARQSFQPYRAREFVVGYGTRDAAGDAEAQRAAFFACAPRARGRRLVLFLSRIHEKKGVDLLIVAFARCAAAHPDADLVIAGPDQSGLRPKLTAIADRLGVADRIHWPGMLTGEAKWGAFRAAEFFVLPSHQENFGIVVAEAMARGKPLLVTDKVNIWREVEADGAGIVVNDDLEGVAAGLQRALALTADERERMGAAARRSFENRYDLEKNALQLLDIIAAASPARTQSPRSRSARA
jgi:glycosyltransferase involved in cell wall biosynthesis